MESRKHCLDEQTHIWISFVWWQGLEQAPNLVKVCVDSIKKNAGDHRVIVLTEDNYNSM